MERKIRAAIERVMNQEEVSWSNRELSMIFEKYVVRKNNDYIKLYVNTQRMLASPERTEEIMERLKEELRKINVNIVEEEVLYSFEVITVKL